MPRSCGKDMCEIFGFTPDDLSPECRNYWAREICPFIGTKCTKFNHDKSVIYGVCSVVTSNKEIIICPKRLYAESYKTLRDVCADAFGYLPLYLVNEVKTLELVKETPNEFVVAFGQNSGREIQVGSSRNKLSMDWVLVRIVDGRPFEIAGVEVQSIVHGKIRNLQRTRVLRVSLEEFALNFISGGKIPGSTLDEAVKQQVQNLLKS